MRRLSLFLALLAASAAALPGAAPAGTDAWAAQANRVCVVWLAKAKTEFAAPVQPSQLRAFAVKAKALESAELAELQKIPNRSAAGTHALVVMRADVAEVAAAIRAWDRGDKASFVTQLKAYLNDHRAKAAFAAAGAGKCG